MRLNGWASNYQPGAQGSFLVRAHTQVVGLILVGVHRGGNWEATNWCFFPFLPLPCLSKINKCILKKWEHCLILSTSVLLPIWSVLTTLLSAVAAVVRAHHSFLSLNLFFLLPLHIQTPGFVKFPPSPRNLSHICPHIPNTHPSLNSDPS